jgi:predicted HicB family RNase H-like nuclease
MSPASKAQQKAVTKYVKEKYDRIVVTMPKGKREMIKAVADAQGESLNGFVSKAVDERIERLTSGETNQ